MNNKYSKRSIQKILQAPSPRILLNVGTHGTERVGLRVAKYFERMKPSVGTFIINVANEKAVAAHKRFIEHDLNRVFPGKRKGSYEERLAYKMVPFIRVFDVVIDIHSTESGVSSSLIVTHFSSVMQPIFKVIAPRRILHMKATKSNALISEAKLGFAFEYGKDKSDKTYHATVLGIRRLLGYYGMTNTLARRNNKRVIEFYEVTKSIPKPDGFLLGQGIKNFVLIKKGSIIGYNQKTGKKILAGESFYPILFGKNTYKTIFGFAAKKCLL